MNAHSQITIRALVVFTALAVVPFIPQQVKSLEAQSLAVADTNTATLSFPHFFAEPEEFTGDDSQKIQQAINSLVNGGVVLLKPRERYDLTNSVYYKSNVEILGDSTVIDFGGKNGPVVAFDRPEGIVERVEFNGIVFTCDDKVPDDLRIRNGQGKSIAIKGFFTEGANDFRVVNCSFLNIAGKAIFLKGVSGVLISRCNFSGVNNVIELGGTGDSVNYRIKGVTNLKVNDNNFYNCTSCIVFQGLSDVTIGQYKPAGLIGHIEANGNSFKRVPFILIEFYAFCKNGIATKNTAADCPGGALIAKLSRNIAITKNRVPTILVQGNTTDPGGYDFALRNIVIDSNIVDGESSVNNDSRGIAIWRQANNVQVAYNDIFNCSVGMSIGMTQGEDKSYPTEHQTAIYIEHNDIHANSLCGITVGEMFNSSISSNHIYDNGTAGALNGIGIRFNWRDVDCRVDSNTIDNINSGTQRLQAVGIYIGKAVLVGTTFKDNLVRNNKNADVYGPSHEIH